MLATDIFKLYICIAKVNKKFIYKNINQLGYIVNKILAKRYFFKISYFILKTISKFIKLDKNIFGTTFILVLSEKRCFQKTVYSPLYLQAIMIS